MQILKYDDDSLSLDIQHSLDYPDEIWLISSPSFQSRDLAIGTKSYIDIGSYSDTWTSSHKFELNSKPTSISWDDKLYFSTSTDLFLCDLATQSYSSLYSTSQLNVCQIDPHHKFLLALGNNSDLLIFDTRDRSNRYSISNIHGGQVLDLDFNPNNPYHLASCGKDSHIKFWDIRKQNCLKTIKDHSHYVWQVKYNSFHDQLLISASSDNSVVLHRVVSASSAPVDESFFEKETDLLVCKLDSFEDSVYACTWLGGEAWHFACVSYDGKVVIGVVPSEEKYKILL